MKTGTRGREIEDACYIAEKRKKVTINRSKKLISYNETAQTSAIFLSIHIELPITDNTYLHAFGQEGRNTTLIVTKMG